MGETEITIQVLNDVENAQEIIRDLGFKIVENVKMVDYYYTKLSNEELKELPFSEIIRNSFLIREMVSESENSTKIIYKNKIFDENENVISEEKIKCKIEDVNSVCRILDMVKLNCYCVLRQNMDVYVKDGESFLFQQVSGLGNFIEYEEDPSMKNLNCEEKIEVLKGKVDRLGLKLGDDYSCKKLYLKLKSQFEN